MKRHVTKTNRYYLIFAVHSIILPRICETTNVYSRPGEQNMFKVSNKDT